MVLNAQKSGGNPSHVRTSTRRKDWKILSTRDGMHYREVTTTWSVHAVVEAGWGKEGEAVEGPARALARHAGQPARRRLAARTGCGSRVIHCQLGEDICLASGQTSRDAMFASGMCPWSKGWRAEVELRGDLDGSVRRHFGAPGEIRAVQVASGWWSKHLAWPVVTRAGWAAARTTARGMGDGGWGMRAGWQGRHRSIAGEAGRSNC